MTNLERPRSWRALCLAALVSAAWPAAEAASPALRADVQCFSRLPVSSASPLASQLPAITPMVVHWAESQAAQALEGGARLPERLERLARGVGVQRPANIRLAIVDRIPLPQEPALQQAAATVGVVPQSAGGLTLGYAVLIVRGFEDDLRLLSHEFRHVAQYEACGGIPAFLGTHLGHLAHFGYDDAPFELDAKAHEVN